MDIDNDPWKDLEQYVPSTSEHFQATVAPILPISTALMDLSIDESKTTHKKCKEHTQDFINKSFFLKETSSVCLKATKNVRRQLHLFWESELPSRQLEFTPYKRFLPTFLARTKLMVDPVLSLNMIECGFKKLSLDESLNPTSSLSDVSMTSYKEEMWRNYLQQLKAGLKSCQGKNEFDVALATLLVAQSFKIFSPKTNDYKRYAGLAQAIIRGSGCSLSQMPDEVTESYLSIIIAPHLEVPAIGVEMIKCFISHFRLDWQYFEQSFPLLCEYLKHHEGPSFSQTFQDFDPEIIEDFNFLFERPTYVQLQALLTFPSRYFRETLTNNWMAASMKLLALEELNHFTTVVKTAYQCPTEYIIPGVHIFLLLLEGSCFLLRQEISEAKHIFALVNDVETFDLCNSLIFYEAEHWLHFIAAAMSLLHMSKEYETFQQKMNIILRLRGAERLPDSLPALQHGVLNSTCEDTLCLVLWQAVAESFAFPTVHKNALFC